MRVGTVKLSWPTRCQGAKFAYWRERFSGCFLTLLTLHKLFKLVDDLRIGNLAYKDQRAVTIDVICHHHFLRPYQFDMPHFDVGRAAPATAPVGISEIPAHFVFKGRIAENGLENQFVRAIGIDEKLHDTRIAGDEILDMGAGIVRQRPPGAARVRSKRAK